MELQPVTCTACGTALDANALFCPHCGRSRTATEPPALSADPLVGRQIIGQYVIVRKLAEGGMGAVYLADQPSVGRQAVVKVMHPELSRDASVAARFELEARAASLLNHPNIVTIYNYGAMEDGTLFLAMEYCRGDSLAGLVSEGALAWDRAARVAVQICDALAEAHRRGIVHRDLKPSNIMLVDAGRHHDLVKVLDFGIAKLEGTRMTRTGAIIGTPQYMSPEQFRGEKLDGRSDLYSLGVVIYEMVCGKLPFESQNTAGFMHKHLEESPPPPGIRVPGLRVPRGLEAVILCALAKQPDERFADAEEMARALEAAVASPEQIPATRLMQAGARRRRLWVGVAAGAAVAAALSGGAVVLLGRQAPNGAPAAGSSPGAVWMTPGPSGTKAAGAAGDRLASAPDAAILSSGMKSAGGRLVGSEAEASVVTRRPRTPQGKGRRAATRLASASKLPGASEPPPRAGNAGATATPASPPADPPKAPPAPRETAAVQTAETKSTTALLADLKRLMSTARVPPSEWESMLGAYHKAEAGWAASEREARAREFLGQLIATYRKPSMQLGAGERKSLPRLRQIFLSVPTKAPLTADERSRILDATLSTYDRGNRPEKDRDYFKRMAILDLIKRYAVDPEQALR